MGITFGVIIYELNSKRLIIDMTKNYHKINKY